MTEYVMLQGFQEPGLAAMEVGEVSSLANIGLARRLDLLLEGKIAVATVVEVRGVEPEPVVEAPPVVGYAFAEGPGIGETKDEGRRTKEGGRRKAAVVETEEGEVSDGVN